MLIASPAVSRLMYKNAVTKRIKQITLGKEDERDLPAPSQMPDSSSSARICLIHRAKSIADMATPGNVYQSALTCFAAAQGQTEDAVIEDIRRNRRLATPPESSRLQYEAATGMYYDPETELHYDAKTGYFYDAVKSTYYHWSAAEQRYVPSNEIVRSQMAAAQEAHLAAIRAAAQQSFQQQEAARAAGARVAAQLAAMRAEKDEYASYAYATCFLSQQEQAQRDGSSAIASASSAAIEDTLKLLGQGGRQLPAYPPSGPSSTSHVTPNDGLYPPGCPPPPGT